MLQTTSGLLTLKETVRKPYVSDALTYVSYSVYACVNTPVSSPGQPMDHSFVTEMFADAAAVHFSCFVLLWFLDFFFWSSCRLFYTERIR